MWLLVTSGRAAGGPLDVRLAPPPEWTQDEAFGPPDLSQTPQLITAQWRAWTRDRAELVAACFEARLGTWSPEMEPLALERLASLAAATVRRTEPDAPLHVTATTREADVAMQSLDGAGASARTWLAFTRTGDDGYAALGCMASCAHGPCEAIVAQARLVGPRVPPPPLSLPLRALLALVHHPRATALASATFAFLVGALAVATRRRPRGDRGRRAPARSSGLRAE